jgi:DNA adenine methylase
MGFDFMSANKKVKPLISRAGGKTCLLKELLPLLGVPHRCYVEVFGGGLAVLLAKGKQTGVVEVCNDIDADLVNFYRVAKAHGPELRRMLRGQINSRLLFNEAKAVPVGETDCQRAARYWLRNALSFGSDGNSFGVKKTAGGGAASRWSGKLLALRAFARRMDGVIIEHLDWTRMLKNYDGPETLFFLDPPYVGGAQKVYKAWTMQDMEVFHAAVCALKGRWVVTVGDTPEMRALWKGHRQKRVVRSLSLRKTEANVKKKGFGELIVIKATGGASNE